MTNYYENYIPIIIDYLYEKKVNSISVKKIRRYIELKAKNRSVINFIFRALIRLEEVNFLKYIEHTKPKRYYLTETSKELITNLSKIEMIKEIKKRLDDL